ncbi:MAG TPA: hypothetical protein VMI06_10335, partial [Terriglobia bacterium]|nr:hypothetical protein [Terriglobia bacterium]
RPPLFPFDKCSLLASPRRTVLEFSGKPDFSFVQVRFLLSYLLSTIYQGRCLALPLLPANFSHIPVLIFSVRLDSFG